MSDPLAHRKARGAFFTPPAISRFIATWAIRSPSDTVLEPSCGEASFLHPAGDQLRMLAHAQLQLDLRQLQGVEIHAPSAAIALQSLEERGYSAKVEVADFFDVAPEPRFDAVIGNPPYVRYQQFAGPGRLKGAEAALRAGVRLNGLASSWAPFVVHSAQFLKTGGRLGLVLPAELLSVGYAAAVRRFLLQRFGKIRLVLFDELVFPGVLEEVVLLLAEGEGPAPSFEVFQARDVSALASLDPLGWTGFTPLLGDKWTPALLPASAVELYRRLTETADFAPMLNWGETYLGSVTGNNKFFTLSAEEAKQAKLSPATLLPISPPGSRHLRGLTFSEGAWEELKAAGARTYLFYPRKPSQLSAAAERYIAKGEKLKVDGAYKCSSRTPWWRVPLVGKPDLLLTYMDHDRPRLTTNRAGVHHLNSLYGVQLKPDLRQLGMDLLPIASLNSLTLLGAEIVGRAYGGGLLKLEPTEADALPLPSKALILKTAESLRALRPQLASALRGGKLASAVRIVDRVILTDALGLSRVDLKALQNARELLFARRVIRGRGARGE